MWMEYCLEIGIRSPRELKHKVNSETNSMKCVHIHWPSRPKVPGTLLIYGRIINKKIYFTPWAIVEKYIL